MNLSQSELRQMNIELTTACPLHCPQCYCTLEGGRHIDYDVAVDRISQGAALGVTDVYLSGGETLCYPRLYDLISFISKIGLSSHIAISGAFFSQSVYEKLINAGVSSISVSLNGSTEEVNSGSRDGYNLAIHALEILRDNHYPKTILNWVMHATNADDFLDYVALAERYHVASIDVIGSKPDAANCLETLPSKEQIRQVTRWIKQYSGTVDIAIESCYSHMLAYFLDTRLMGNLNIGPEKGCLAGRIGVSVNVGGEFIPCRHIDSPESYERLDEYWSQSEMLHRIRNAEKDCREPCILCKYQPYCRHCQAISWQIHGEIFTGFTGCPVFSEASK